MLRRLQPMCVMALLICWLAADRLVAQRSAASALRGPDVEALLQQGKPTEALPILNRLHEAEPHNVRVCYQLGLAYTQLQEFVRAAEFYRKALKLNPGFVAARKNLGTVLWFSNQKEASVQEFRTVLRSLPNDPVSHLYLGSQAYEQRRFAEAKRHFEKAGDLAMQNPEALPMVLETYLATRDLSVLERVTQQLMTAHDPDPQLVFQDWCGARPLRAISRSGGSFRTDPGTLSGSAGSPFESFRRSIGAGRGESRHSESGKSDGFSLQQSRSVPPSGRGV